MNQVIATLLLIGSPILLGQQEDSLIRFAREHGGTAIRYLDTMTPISTIEGSLVALSTVIVKGSIRSVRTRLSADERDVETAFEVAPFRYFRGSMAVATRPGETKPLIVSRTGGTIIMDGLHLETHIDLFPESESFGVGDMAFLFLSRDDRNPEEFRLTDGPFGAFRITNGTVRALTQMVAHRRGDGTPTVEEFERRVEAAIAAHRGR